MNIFRAELLTTAAIWGQPGEQAVPAHCFASTVTSGLNEAGSVVLGHSAGIVRSEFHFAEVPRVDGPGFAFYDDP